MTDATDAYWDELGIAWHAIDPALDVQTQRLEAHFRRQSLLIGLAIAGGAILGVAGLALGAFTLWQAWALAAWNFGTRGAAIVTVAALMLLAVRALWPVRASDQALALPTMIELGRDRAARGLRVVRLGLIACAAAAVLGLAGTAIRYRLGRPPALSPLIDLAVLALCALALWLYGRHLRRELAKFAYLKRALNRSDT